MKNNFLLMLSYALFISCSCSTKNKDVQDTVNQKYITVVEKENEFCSAYTEDGSTMIYGKDSIGNYIIYFAKFDNNAGKYENRIIKEKAIRVELDSSLSILKGFVTISVGAFCDINEEGGYNVYYFDEKLNGRSLDWIGIPLNTDENADIDHEKKIKKILELLNVGYNIALSINNTNAEGWYNVVSALEPFQNLLTYDIMNNDMVYSPNVKKHISKIKMTTDGLSQFNSILLKKKNGQNEFCNFPP